MEKYKIIFKHILKWESTKLHTVKFDNGGSTHFGLTYKNNHKYFKNFKEFENLTVERATEIAYIEYYKPLPIKYIPNDCLAMMADIAFNAGVKRAIILAQRALGISDDGIIGNITLSKLKDLDKKKLYNERMKHYKAIVANNPTQKKFLNGWQNRANYFLVTKI